MMDSTWSSCTIGIIKITGSPIRLILTEPFAIYNGPNISLCTIAIHFIAIPFDVYNCCSQTIIPLWTITILTLSSFSLVGHYI
jgi:hypothetical protein